ncbi:uncharacterized protein LOC124885240 [Capsicum annuum]|uniref:uncharacterized protein LOC124885240 n=1 Tax=Capsicum annuum TaxID=4072 RepID=UPI001FB12BBF|nr:uncharacterized protein LOC124885240 [Capsicum annuum]
MPSNSTPGTSATETTSNAPVPVVLPYVKLFPDVSNIEIFANENFKRWQEQIFSLLDVHGVAYALAQTQPSADVDGKIWSHGNTPIRKESFKDKQAALNANLVQGQQSNNKRYGNKFQGYKPNNPNFKKKKRHLFYLWKTRSLCRSM